MFRALFPYCFFTFIPDKKPKKFCGFFPQKIPGFPLKIIWKILPQKAVGRLYASNASARAGQEVPPGP
jgi:hypothetical protein